MKKRLEAELISIAHRVLKLKNKSEVDQLFAETQKLYEALSVLKFYGDYIEHHEPEIPQDQLEEKLTDSLEGTKTPSLDNETKADLKKEAKEVVAVDEESEPDPIVEEPVIVGEINIEDEEEDDTEEPAANEEEEAKEEEEAHNHSDPIFEMAAEAPADEKEEEKQEEEPAAQKPQKQISFEDFLGDFKEVEFVKPNDTSLPAPPKEEPQAEAKEKAAPAPPAAEKAEPASEPEAKTEPKEEKTPILNEKLATGINIGLNDRVGFVKYLFDGSNEDFNRVLSQLNTFDTLAEAKEFIHDMVKPDYNNWKGQEDYEERFMEIVGQKFN